MICVIVLCMRSSYSFHSREEGYYVINRKNTNKLLKSVCVQYAILRKQICVLIVDESQTSCDRTDGMSALTPKVSDKSRVGSVGMTSLMAPPFSETLTTFFISLRDHFIRHVLVQEQRRNKNRFIYLDARYSKCLRWVSFNLLNFNLDSCSEIQSFNIFIISW